MQGTQGAEINGVRNRRGTALIVAVVCLGLVSAMTVTLVQIVTMRQSQTNREQWRVQSMWLAESALARAMARLTADEAYTGETWEVGEIDAQHHSGISQIEVGGEGAQRRIFVTADFPRDHTDRVRTTRTWTIERKAE